MSSDILQGIVLNLRNSGKSDVLTSIILSNGELLVVLAKNARKKNSKFTSALVLGNALEVKILKGYSLPILTEATILQSNFYTFVDHNSSSCFYIALEVLLKFCHLGRENIELYSLAENYIKSSTKIVDLPAFLIEVMSVEGLLDKTTLESGYGELSIEWQNYDNKSDGDVNQVEQTEKSLNMIKSIISHMEEVGDFILKTKQMLL